MFAQIPLVFLPVCQVLGSVSFISNCSMFCLLGPEKDPELWGQNIYSKKHVSLAVLWKFSENPKHVSAERNHPGSNLFREKITIEDNCPITMDTNCSECQYKRRNRIQISLWLPIVIMPPVNCRYGVQVWKSSLRLPGLHSSHSQSARAVTKEGLCPYLRKTACCDLRAPTAISAKE